MANERPTNLIGTSIIAVAVVVSTYLFGNAIIRTRTGGQEIRVTGSARKEIKSDFIIWRANIGVRGDTVTSAYNAVKDGSDKLVAYLKKKGLEDSEIVRGAFRTSALYEQRQNNDYSGDTFRKIVGYDISQDIEVQSAKVDLVDEISRSSTELIASGVPMSSNPPQFLYTKISEEKREILGLAAEDARKRAEQIATKSGARVTDVRGARMSPLQITPKFEQEILSEGQNDTSAKDKAITAIVTMTFGVQ